MNRIDQLFQIKADNILSVFFTAGYPDKGDTVKIIKYLDEAGVDMIEVGMPFSDPMADGPTIQESNKIALKNGMTLTLLFEQLKDIRQTTNIPILLMGYLNPVLHFGVEKFCRKCNEAGVDGIILPDLPVEVYQQEYKSLFLKYDLHNIFLVAPTTSRERLKIILPEAGGFVYMVSSSSTTGNTGRKTDQLSYADTIREIRNDIPIMIGFGIDNSEKFQKVCSYANGGIIGSAFIKALGIKHVQTEDQISSFIKSIRPKENSTEFTDN